MLSVPERAQPNHGLSVEATKIPSPQHSLHSEYWPSGTRENQVSASLPNFTDPPCTQSCLKEIADNFLSVKTLNQTQIPVSSSAPFDSTKLPGLFDMGSFPTRLFLQDVPLFAPDSWRPRSSLESSPGSSASSVVSEASSENLNLEGSKTFTELYEKFTNVLRTNPEILHNVDQEKTAAGSLDSRLTNEQKTKLMGASDALKRHMKQKKEKDCDMSHVKVLCFFFK